VKVRLGIVGCGAVAERYHLPAIAALDEVELVVVCDAAPARAKAFAAAAGVAHVAERHTELVGDVDAAIVAVPNHLHQAVASDLLRQGVHVLVEKPMAVDVAQCDAMIEAAREGGAVLAVGHDFRYFPVATFAKNVLASGVLGSVRRVDLRQSATGRWPYSSDYIFSPATAGGGVLIDFGVHMLDLLSWWLGESEVTAFRDDARGGVESECELELELQSGAPVWIELSRLRELRDTVVVECECGTVEIGIFEPAVLRLTLADGGPALAGDVPDPRFASAPLVTVFTRQLADFTSAIATRRSPLVTGADGRRAVATVEAAYSLRGPLRRPWDFPEAYASIGRERS